MVSRHKQTVNDVLNHRQPEYIPVGTYAIDCDTVEKVIGHETYVRNKVKTQVALWEGRRSEVVQSLREDSVALFKKLDGLDIIIPFKEAPLLPPADYVPPKVKKLDDTTWELEDGHIYKYSYATNDITVVKYPDKEYNIEALQYHDDFVPPDNSVFEAYDYLVEHMQDRSIAGSSGGFDPMVMLGGMEKGLMEYYLNPERVKAVIDYKIRYHNFLDKYYIRNGVEHIFVELDPATTTAPLISPEMFREFCFPAMSQRVQNIQKYREKVILHSCGNTWSLMDMFVEAGFACNQSLQTGAGMDIGLLKEKYGDVMSYWGGVSVEKLISGSMREVRDDVRYAMEHASKNGGFILGPSHSIAFGVKYDNFMAMLDEHDKLKYSYVNG